MGVIAFPIGNPIVKASQETEIFNKIEVKELIIKNNKGNEVITIRSTPEEDGAIAIYNQKGVVGVVIGGLDTGGRILTFNKNQGLGIANIATEEGGEVQIFNKDGKIGINLVVDKDGSKIATIDKNGVIGTVMATVNSMGGGLIVFDEKGKNKKMYSSR